MIFVQRVGAVARMALVWNDPTRDTIGTQQKKSSLWALGFTSFLPSHEQKKGRQDLVVLENVMLLVTGWSSPMLIHLSLSLSFACSLFLSLLLFWVVVAAPCVEKVTVFTGGADTREKRRTCPQARTTPSIPSRRQSNVLQ